jgi:hypothetical protein
MVPEVGERPLESLETAFKPHRQMRRKVVSEPGDGWWNGMRQRWR